MFYFLLQWLKVFFLLMNRVEYLIEVGLLDLYDRVWIEIVSLRCRVHVCERVADLRLAENLFLFFSSFDKPSVDNVLILSHACSKKLEVTLNVLHRTVDVTPCHYQLALRHELVDTTLRILVLPGYTSWALWFLVFISIVNLFVIIFLFLTIFLFDLFHLQFLTLWSKMLSDISNII